MILVDIGNLPYIATLGLLGWRRARHGLVHVYAKLQGSGGMQCSQEDSTRWHWHSPYSFTAAGGFIQGTNYLIAANVPYIYSAANLQDGTWLTRRG